MSFPRLLPRMWEKRVRFLYAGGKHPSKPNYVRITPNMGFGFITRSGQRRIAVSRRRGIELFEMGKVDRRAPDGWVRIGAWFSPMKTTKGDKPKKRRRRHGTVR